MAKGNQKALDSKQSLKKDERGVIELAQLGIGILVLIVIIAVIALVGDKIDTVAALEELTAATGTITFTGTAVAGETVNISSETYTLTNGTGGAFNVNIGAGTANASYTTSQLVAEITANSTLVTAANNGDNSSTVTAVTAGTGGNAYATTTNVTGGSWGAATLTGGLAGSQWSNTVNSDIVTGVELWEDTGGLIIITAVVAIIGVLLSYIFILGRTPGRGEQ